MTAESAYGYIVVPRSYLHLGGLSAAALWGGAGLGAEFWVLHFRELDRKVQHSA